MSADLVLSGDPLTTADVLSVARSDRPVGLSQAARARVAECRAALDAASSDGLPHYGVNTGFGSFSRERVSDEELRALQVNLVRSHAAGAGDPLPRDVVRGMMLLTAASLARGVSGVRPEVIDTLLSFLNKGVTPVVPELGSVGASGDLAPLAHVALALIGEGPTDGDSDGVAIAPLGLEAKEGLALLNGTHLMAARASLAVEEMNVLLRAAAGIAAVSLDATRSTDRFLDPRVYEARNQPGPSRVASAMLSALEGSTIVSSHVENDPRVQDPYSIRCAPIVLGSVLDQLDAVRAAVSNELGAVTDNPLVFGAGAGRPAEIVSAGNFHGMPVAIPLDTIALLCAHVAGISERRLYYLVSARDPELQLRPFLSPRPGLHSGYMIVQYTAAAMCNELIGLATPASVSNIPTCAGMEDYNSFGPRAAAKAARAIDLTRRVLACELLCAAQGIDAHRPLRSGEGVEALVASVRERVEPLDADRPPSPDLDAVTDLLRDPETTTRFSV